MLGDGACDPREPGDETNWRATVLVISRRMTQTILTTLALCFSLVAMPVLAEVNVRNDLESFSRWTSQSAGIAGPALYTLRPGNFNCPPFTGENGDLLRFDPLVTRVCQIGEVTGTETNDIWDRTVKLKW